MWIKLANEYINLDQAFRVRISKGFRNGDVEWIAEVETMDPNGQVGTVTRYRGADAQLLQALLSQRARTDSVEAVGVLEKPASSAMTGTVADINLP
jgi:hypothetical protein